MEATQEKHLLAREPYLAVKAAWKTHSDAKAGTAWHHLAYLILTERSIDKAFAPVESERRIAGLRPQGRGPRYKLEEACRELRLRIESSLRYGARNDEGDVAFELRPTANDFVLPAEILDAMTAEIDRIIDGM